MTPYNFLLDENLSRRLVSIVGSQLGSIVHVSELDLLNVPDGTIWKYAKEHNGVIVTKDNDFFDMSHLYGCPPKVIKLSCGNRTTQFIAQLIISNIHNIQEFVGSDKCYLEIF